MTTFRTPWQAVVWLAAYKYSGGCPIYQPCIMPKEDGISGGFSHPEIRDGEPAALSVRIRNEILRHCDKNEAVSIIWLATLEYRQNSEGYEVTHNQKREIQRMAAKVDADMTKSLIEVGLVE
jgi:hypothetical protein